ncbi:MAG TPA: hypothetical protein VE956_01360 [Nodularia sp. (in: cyanobacteria)]|nr:hypothetical protein [Nodularia sp. (in: cyanobacteria)]
MKVIGLMRSLYPLISVFNNVPSCRRHLSLLCDLAKADNLRSQMKKSTLQVKVY